MDIDEIDHPLLSTAVFLEGCAKANADPDEAEFCTRMGEEFFPDGHGGSSLTHFLSDFLVKSVYGDLKFFEDLHTNESSERT